MDQRKARDFWKTVVDSRDTLCAVLDASPTEQGLSDRIQLIGRIVQRLRDIAEEIDPLLSVEVDQVPLDDSAVVRIAIGCNHDPDGIEAVQELVAAAPAMPPRIQVCAFTPPTPKEMARDLASLEVLGKKVQVHQVRFMAEPSTAAPDTFDVACFVPRSAVTEMDPQNLPGALVADIMLNMGIGELRLMTRVRSIGIAVTDQPPPESLNAWDLVEIIDSAPAH
jgi:hypothetical protein